MLRHTVTAAATDLTQPSSTPAPLWLLACGLAATPLVFVRFIDDAFALPKTVAVYGLASLALAILSWGLINETSDRYSLGWIEILVIAFLGGNFMAFVFSIDRGQSLFGERLQYQGLVTVVAHVAVFFVARGLQPPSRYLVPLFGIAVATAAVVSTYALMQRAGLDPFWDDLANGRVFSTLGQPNALAAYLVLNLPLGAALLWLAAPARRLLVVGAIGLMAAALGFTLSRAGTLGFTTALAIFTLAMRRQIPWQSVRFRRWGAGLFIAIVGAVTLVAPIRSSAADFLDRTGRGLDADGFEVRQLTALWEVGVAIAVDHPIVGAGQETYPLLFTEYQDRILDPYRASVLSAYRPESPHNTYIGLAAGTGFPTMIVYLALLAGVGVTLVKALRATGDVGRRASLAGLVAATAGYAVTDAFRTPDPTGAWMLWVLLGLAVGITATQETSASGWRRSPFVRL